MSAPEDELAADRVLLTTMKNTLAARLQAGEDVAPSELETIVKLETRLATRETAQRLRAMTAEP